MAVGAPHERFRQARAERGEALDALSARTGLRVQHVRAIEDGRFGDLPPGIYGRAAVRTLAAAYALDADELLAGCESLLPQIEDPIGALARMRGVAPPAAPAGHEAPSNRSADPAWRPFAAATIDGAVAGALLLVSVAAAALLARVSIAGLDGSPVPLFLLGVVLGAAYYTWVGGLAGTTLGEYAVGPESRPRDPRPLTLRAIALRARAAATADARAIHDAGAWVGRRLTRGAARSAPPTAPSPLPPPPRDRAEGLTWSMSRRASVPPLPLRPRRG